MIKEIEPQDYEQIYQLGNILHSNYQELFDLETCQKNDYFHLLGYYQEKKVIGFLSYTNLYNTIDILDLVVAEEYRRQHVAANLLDYMITSLEPQNVIFLDVAINNKPAISLYQKFGFKIIHTRKKYYDEQDAYTMERVNSNV